MAKEELVTSLVSRGENLGFMDEFENTALHFAVMQNVNLDILNALKEKYALDIPNKLGETALMLAASSGKKEIIKSLLESGANINLRDNKGNTAFHRFLEYILKHRVVDPTSNPPDSQRDEIFQLLSALDKDKTSLNVADTWHNYTPLMTALNAELPYQRTLVSEWLLDRGAETHHLIGTTFPKITVFHCVALCTNFNIMKRLKDTDPDIVNIRDQNGSTPLMHLAHHHGSIQSLLYLIHMGADTELKNKNGKTAKDIANKAEYAPVKKFFNETIPKIQENMGTHLEDASCCPYDSREYFPFPKS